MAVQFSDVSAILKTIFPPGKPESLASRARPFLTMVGKKADFFGNTLEVPVIEINPQGRSVDPARVFAAASTQNTSMGFNHFTITKYDNLAAAPLHRKAIAAASNDKGAFVDLVQTTTEGILDSLGDALSSALYGDGTGTIGVRGSLSGEVVTLSVASDAGKLYRGQTLQVFNGAGPSLRTITAGSGYLGNAVTIASVDEENGKFTLTTGDAAAIGSFGDGDAFVNAGDTGNTGVMPGLGGWIPLVTPTSSTFFGVNRALDPTRRAGVRLDNATGAIEDNIMTVAERVYQVGKKAPDAAFISPSNWSTLSKSVDSKHVYYDAKQGDVGFESLRVMCSGGPVKVYADPSCPSNRGYVLTMDSWTVHHLLGLPHLIDDGGSQMLQPMDAQNAVMIKAAYYAALACNTPARNGVFSI